jgi:diguanylate cyclase (GGDEF)-like protein/PAS domain S-box-containing protein
MMSLGSIVLQLVQNVSLFAAVVVGYAAIRRRTDLAPWAIDLLVGLIFAAGSVLSMSLPVVLAPGLIIDGRSVLTGSVALFAGPIGTLVTLTIAAGYRLWLGGAGAIYGATGVVAACLVGWLFALAIKRKRLPAKPWVFFVLGTSVIATTLTLYTVLRPATAPPVPDGLIAALILVIPVSTMVLCLMLLREDARLTLQQKLAEQTALFEAIFNSMSDGVTVADAAGRIILTNPMSEKLAGVTPSDRPKESWSATFGVFLSDGVTPFPAVHMPLVRAVNGEVTDDVEMIVDNAGTGRQRRLSVSGRPLRDAKGQSRGGVVVFRDNTEQREMQDSLRRSEERFALAIAGSKDGIFDYNPITGQVWFSPRYKAILGYRDAEFPNDMAFWKSRMLPEDHARSTEQFFQYQAGQIDGIEIRQRFRHRDGSIVHVQNRASGTRDEKGRITRLVGAITDVTPLILAEQRLKDAIGAMESGFALFDVEDRLVLCNDGFVDPATRARFGMPIGRTFAEIFATFAEGRLTAVDARSDPAGWLAWRMEQHRNPPAEPLEVQWTDGRWMRVTERRTADGGRVGIWTDITRQKAAEVQLRDAINGVNEGFALFDHKLNYIICNQPYLDQYPITAEAIRPGVNFAVALRHGAEHGEIPDVSTPAEIDAFVDDCMARYNCTFPFVKEVESKDGRWLLISHQRTATGSFVTLRTDITAQKRREQELRHTQEQLQMQAVELERYVRDVEEARARIEMQAAEQIGLMEELKLAQMETQRAHQELQQAAAILRRMTDSLPALVADVDADGRYRYCNNLYLDFFARGAEETIGRHVRDVYGEQAFKFVAPDMEQAMRGKEVGFRRALQSGGRLRQLEGRYLPQIDIDGGVNGFYMAAWDVTEQYEREQQLSREVSTDALTGVLNRRAILAALADLPTRFSQGMVGAALLYLDIDHFKHINDSLGHAAGDQLLKIFAQRLRHAVRASDLVARLGGDEFVILLVDVAQPAVAERIALQILTQMREPAVLAAPALDTKKVSISTSIGIAYDGAGPEGAPRGIVGRKEDGADAAGLLSRADVALYQAKAAGRNTYRLFQIDDAQVAQSP